MPLLQNTTGISEPEKYVLGRGKLYLAVLNTSKLPDNNGWRFLGNCSEFSLNTTEETIKHMSSQTGLKKVDREATLSFDLTGQFTLEEFNADNLADLLRGTVATHTNVAIAGFSAYDMVTVASGGVKTGRWYDIVNSVGERAYDVAAGDLTVKYDGTTPASGTTGTEGTDYDLDSKMGRIFIKPTGNISDGDGINVTLAAAAGAKPVTEILGLQATDQDSALKFILENANDADAQAEIQFHLVKLKANGDVGLITDDWATMPFTFTAEENVALGGADSPLLTIRSHADA